MKNVLKALAIMAALSLTCTAMAKGPTTKPGGLRGRVEKVDGMTITIKNKNGETIIETDASTTFLLDGKPATLADVKEGERLTATPSTGVATEVKLMSAKKKKRGPTTSPAAN